MLAGVMRPTGRPPARPGDDERARLAAFNGLPGAAARRAALDCCSSARWADAVVAGRPYDCVAGLLGCADAAADGLSQADLRDALAGHRRIGERRAVATGHDDSPDRAGRSDHADRADRWSRQEQAAVVGAAELTRQALADGNAAYEQRFGHIYLVCATGRSAGELLDVLRARLGHDSETERHVVRSELKKINRIRLRKLIGDTA